MVQEILKTTKLSIYVIYLDSATLVFQYILLIFIIYAGSVVTKEVKTAVKNISKLMDDDEAHYIDSVNFISQISARNLNVENFLFSLNWEVLLTVT